MKERLAKKQTGVIKIIIGSIDGIYDKLGEFMTP